MSLVKETFQGFYPGTFLDKKAASEMTGTVAAATRTVGTPAEIALRRLNQRDLQTGEPQGVFAVWRERMLAKMFSRRIQKSRRPLSRRFRLASI